MWGKSDFSACVWSFILFAHFSEWPDEMSEKTLKGFEAQLNNFNFPETFSIGLFNGCVGYNQDFCPWMIVQWEWIWMDNVKHLGIVCAVVHLVILWENCFSMCNQAITPQLLPGLLAQSDAHLTCNQEVVGLILRSSTILLLRLIMKSFLRLFSPFCWFKKGSCQLLVKEWAPSTG